MSGLPGLVADDLVRTLRIPEVPRLTVHEVLAPTMLRSVTGDRRHTYEYAVDPMVRDGDDVRVMLNAAAVLRREVRRRSWHRSTVAIGASGSDPYGSFEDRYRLMPGVISTLAESQTPFALHTGSDLVVRDLSLLRVVRHAVPVTVVVAVPCLDVDLCRRADPQGSSPTARIETVRRLAEAGLAPHVQIAPLLPLLTDSTSQLDELLGRLADAGADRVSVSVLQLSDDGYLEWIADEHPALLRRYRSLYGRGSFVPADYAVRLRERMGPLVQAHGLTRQVDDRPAVAVAPPPEPSDDAALTLF
ncbi:sam dependent methyltransferase [Gordonia sp. HY285]|uniref:sam dependent methyltransferase n=1 Tax=Gordonia liuliyuniae TaxID=2911517 RepID=UPI001F35C1C8|nr:sam dependent methyltransferase [Gordonia liuliyuniae]MCF8611704.1 sam dependent methyltransferase [Gordonia liuliyuniae]